MRGVLLIAVLAGCSASPAPVAPRPEPSSPPAETLWDSGTFVMLDRDFVLPDTEESFEIFRTDAGYRITVKWTRPAPTGEPSDGEVTLSTDSRFSPLRGEMKTAIKYTAHQEVTRSTIQRETDGRLTTDIFAPDGSKQQTASKGRNDWYIGGTITTFLVALCQAPAAASTPTVYPDKATTLGALEPLVIEGSEREVMHRVLEYQQSGRRVIVACEDGKLAGEVARGVVIVRRGDLELARTLAKQFR